MDDTTLIVLIASLIVERPTCVVCLSAEVGAEKLSVVVAIERIGRSIQINIANDERCRTCDSTSRPVYSLDRPALNATVVILEDAQDTSALYREYGERLAAAGASVLAPRVDQDVVHLVRTLSGPVAVVVDVGNRAQGVAVVQRLAALRPRPGLVAVSGRRRNEVPNAAMFDAYLLKPCRPETLIVGVRRALGAESFA